VTDLPDDAAAAQRPPVAEPIPAATVILVRDAPEPRPDGTRLEVLMLHRTSTVAFGGMWVFPGGRVEDGDRHPADDGDEPAARRAAVREAAEECALAVDPAEVVAFSRWTPPAGAPKRFATWFFLARVPTGEVVVDGGEILDHRWQAPHDVLAARDRHEVDLAPPTWMTLDALRAARDVEEALAQAAARPLFHYVTRWKVVEGGAVALWQGDAGYDDGDPEAPGARHRLWMLEDGWRAEIGDR
jgi:8-oxo-dGTP pyrophosphatase MutT (NUDIX family)